MDALQGLVFDIRKFSLHDGPGIRTTVFLKGCPLSCWWCHNPESQSSAQEIMLWDSRCIRCGECIEACPEDAIQRMDGYVVTDRAKCTLCAACVDACAAQARELVGREMTAAAVMREIERDRPFFEESGGGVTFSGGEPLAQPAFVADLLRQCQALEIHTTLDTSGLASWNTIDGLRGDVDLFLYDLKVMDEARHRQYTGVSNRQILRNLEALDRLGHRIFVRVPVIPGLNDDEANLRRTAEFVAGLSHVERVDILPYHPSAAGKYERIGLPYRLPSTPTPSDERMNEITSLLEAYDLNVKIGG